MTNPKPSNGFKKGQSGNPAGPKPLPQDLKEARKLTHYEFERLANKYLGMTISEIEPLMKATDLPMLDLMIASCIYRGIKEGSTKHLDFLLNRLIGSVVREIRIKAPLDDNSRDSIPITMSDDEKLVMLDKFRDQITDRRNSVKDVTPKGFKND